MWLSHATAEAFWDSQVIIIALKHSQRNAEWDPKWCPLLTSACSIDTMSSFLELATATIATSATIQRSSLYASHLSPLSLSQSIPMRFAKLVLPGSALPHCRSTESNRYEGRYLRQGVSIRRVHLDRRHR
jgi:hypothetical protein